MHRHCRSHICAVGAHLLQLAGVDQDELEAQAGTPEGEVATGVVLSPCQMISLGDQLVYDLSTGHTITRHIRMIFYVVRVDEDCSSWKKNAIQLAQHPLIIASISAYPVGEFYVLSFRFYLISSLN